MMKMMMMMMMMLIDELQTSDNKGDNAMKCHDLSMPNDDEVDDDDDNDNDDVIGDVGDDYQEYNEVGDDIDVIINLSGELLE